MHKYGLFKCQDFSLSHDALRWVDGGLSPERTAWRHHRRADDKTAAVIWERPQGFPPNNCRESRRKYFTVPEDSPESLQQSLHKFTDAVESITSKVARSRAVGWEGRGCLEQPIGAYTRAWTISDFFRNKSPVFVLIPAGLQNIVNLSARTRDSGWETDGIALCGTRLVQCHV